MLTRHLLYDKSTRHLLWHSQKSAHYSIYYLIYCKADLFFCRERAGGTFLDIPKSLLYSHFTMWIYCRADYLDCRVLTRNSSSKLICRLDTNCVTREQAVRFKIFPKVSMLLTLLHVVTVESWQYIRVVNWYADYTPIVWREHADFSLWRYSHSPLATQFTTRHCRELTINLSSKLICPLYTNCVTRAHGTLYEGMGWLRLVGSLKF